MKLKVFINFIEFVSFMHTKDFIEEEDVRIKSYIGKISRKLPVFYNPVMKINRDISLLVINSYFDKQIKLCDPMAATGIRELRFLKKIPEKFEKITCGDISESAIENLKENFELNNISLDKIELSHNDANCTIHKQFYDFIEIDPFGSPVPFLDAACQKVKHRGILSVTATDTAALCGTYPKTTHRRYGMKVEKTLFEEELGVRNLIAYCQIQAAKYDKSITPLVSFSYQHFYKIFFKVEEGRQKANQMINDLRYINYNRETQEVKVLDYEEKGCIGKTFVGTLNDKEFLKNMHSNLNLIEDDKKIRKLIESLIDEIDTLGYYNTHKLQKSFKIDTNIKFEIIFEKLKEKGYQVSKAHDSRLGIKTDAKPDVIIEILKN